MLFDTEEWKVVSDSQKREYLDGVMDNVVSVYPQEDIDYTVHIRVPTAFFPYLLNVLHYTREKLLDKPISFYLSEMEKGGWLFGFDRNFGEADDTPMWRYPTLPDWARRKR